MYDSPTQQLLSLLCTKYKLKVQYIIIYYLYCTNQPKVRPHLKLNQSKSLNYYKKIYNLLLNVMAKLKFIFNPIKYSPFISAHF